MLPKVVRNSDFRGCKSVSKFEVTWALTSSQKRKTNHSKREFDVDAQSYFRFQTNLRSILFYGTRQTRQRATVLQTFRASILTFAQRQPFYLAVGFAVTQLLCLSQHPGLVGLLTFVFPVFHHVFEEIQFER